MYVVSQYNDNVIMCLTDHLLQVDVVRLTRADVQYCDRLGTLIGSHGGRFLWLNKVDKKLQWLGQLVQTGILEK